MVSQEVTASGIRVQSLSLGNLGSKADFNVRDNGVMYVDNKIEVGHNSHLDINLGEKVHYAPRLLLTTLT